MERRADGDFGALLCSALGLPTLVGRFSRNVSAFACRKTLGARPTTFPSELDSGFVLAVRSRFSDFSCGDLHHMDCVRDNIGGALLTFWTFGHSLAVSIARRAMRQRRD